MCQEHTLQELGDGTIVTNGCYKNQWTKTEFHGLTYIDVSESKTPKTHSIHYISNLKLFHVSYLHQVHEPFVLAYYENMTICVYDLHGQLRYTYNNLMMPVRTLCSLPNGLVVIGSAYQTIFWDTSENLYRIDHAIHGIEYFVRRRTNQLITVLSGQHMVNTWS